MTKTKIHEAIENLKRVVIFEYDNKFVAFDPEVPSWIGLTRKEVKILQELLRSRGNTISDSESLKVISKLISNYLLLNIPDISEHNNRNKMEIRPSIYYVKLTNRCNLRCIYCYNNKDHKNHTYTFSKNNELKTNEWIRVIDEIHENGGREIVLTGGEPLLREDIFRIAKHVTNLGLELSIITNGVLISRRIINNISNYFNHVTISVDSHLEEINSKTRGKYILPKILEGIKMCLSHGLDVSINVVVTKYNMENIFDTIQFFEDIGIQRHNINLIAMLPVGRAKSHLEISVPIKELIEKTSRYSFKKSTLPNMRNAYFERIQRKISCGALRTEVLIDVNGDVYPCRMLEYPEFKLGNITQKKLHHILYSYYIHIKQLNLLIRLKIGRASCRERV